MTLLTPFNLTPNTPNQIVASAPTRLPPAPPPPRCSVSGRSGGKTGAAAERAMIDAIERGPVPVSPTAIMCSSPTCLSCVAQAEAGRTERYLPAPRGRPAPPADLTPPTHHHPFTLEEIAQARRVARARARCYLANPTSAEIIGDQATERAQAIYDPSRGELSSLAYGIAERMAKRALSCDAMAATDELHEDAVADDVDFGTGNCRPRSLWDQPPPALPNERTADRLAQADPTRLLMICEAQDVNEGLERGTTFAIWGLLLMAITGAAGSVMRDGLRQRDGRVARPDHVDRAVEEIQARTVDGVARLSSRCPCPCVPPELRVPTDDEARRLLRAALSPDGVAADRWLPNVALEIINTIRTEHGLEPLDMRETPRGEVRAGWVATKKILGDVGALQLMKAELSRDRGNHLQGAE